MKSGSPRASIHTVVLQHRFCTEASYFWKFFDVHMAVMAVMAVMAGGSQPFPTNCWLLRGNGQWYHPGFETVPTFSHGRCWLRGAVSRWDGALHKNRMSSGPSHAMKQLSEQVIQVWGIQRYSQDFKWFSRIYLTIIFSYAYLHFNLPMEAAEFPDIAVPWQRGLDGTTRNLPTFLVTFHESHIHYIYIIIIILIYIYITWIIHPLFFPFTGRRPGVDHEQSRSEGRDLGGHLFVVRAGWRRRLEMTGYVVVFSVGKTCFLWLNRYRYRYSHNVTI